MFVFHDEHYDGDFMILINAVDTGKVNIRNARIEIEIFLFTNLQRNLCLE